MKGLCRLFSLKWHFSVVSVFSLIFEYRTILVLLRKGKNVLKFGKLFKKKYFLEYLLSYTKKTAYVHHLLVELNLRVVENLISSISGEGMQY